MTVTLHGSDWVDRDAGECSDDVPLFDLVSGHLPPELVLTASHGDHGGTHRVVTDLDDPLLQNCAISRKIHRHPHPIYPPSLLLASSSNSFNDLPPGHRVSPSKLSN